MRLSLEPFGSTDMDVAIEVLPDRPAACLRHVGPYDHAGPTYERVLRWAAATGLLERDAVVMGLSYDDPGAVAEDALRYDGVVGVDHVSTGTDASSSPGLFPDYDNFTALVDAMLRGGCTAADTAKIVGGNYVRIFAASVR
jgi:hypothetical protein